MNRRIESFCSGYANAIRLFPDPEDGMYTDWERIGKDIEVSLKKYNKELDVKSCQVGKKSILQKKKRRRISK